jgi:drug/metabolite transporter (DMT)-like permease
MCGEVSSGSHHAQRCERGATTGILTGVRARLILLLVLAMLAFAGNSLLCRLALQATRIDAASFTSLRLVSGALALWLMVRLRGARTTEGSWISAAALFGYAAAFSFAYASVTAATGALLLFGAVQVTMVGYGFSVREAVTVRQGVGFAFAAGGLLLLLLPGLAAPPLTGALLMLGAGAAWGVYSLRGRGTGDAIVATAGNFLRTVPFALLLSLVTVRGATLDPAGIALALASGVVTSAIGYVIWYTALPSLSVVSSASVQLSVPVFTALGGVLLLGERLSLRLLICAIAILGGIALALGIGDKSRFPRGAR